MVSKETDNAHERMQVRTPIKTLVMTMLITAAAVCAQEVVIRNNFIDITTKIMDALDAVESICDDTSSGKRDIDDALKKLRVTFDTYQRYEGTGRPIDKEQEEIIKAIAKAERFYTIFSASLGPCYAASTEDEILEAKKYSEIARRLFLRYKAAH